jgi:hypothetical protein
VLADFQQAMCDLIAAPALCAAVRRDPAVLRQSYELTVREVDRLTAIARHDGMTAACSLYRANRLAPLVMNLPRTCRTLGPDLRRLVDEFWTLYTESNVHFFVECDRFCGFLESRIAGGLAVEPTALAAFSEESVVLRAALAQSYLEAPDRAVHADR